MSLACGILAFWPKKKGCTEADDARGDYTTVPLEILNLSFVHWYRRGNIVAGGVRVLCRGEEGWGDTYTVSMFPVEIWQIGNEGWWLFMFDLALGAGELPLSSRLVNVGFRLGHVHRSDGYSWYIKYRGAVFSPNDEDLWDGR